MTDKQQELYNNILKAAEQINKVKMVNPGEYVIVSGEFISQLRKYEEEEKQRKLIKERKNKILNIKGKIIVRQQNG